MGEFIKQVVLNNENRIIRYFDVEWKRDILRIECAVLFFIVPLALYWFRHLLAFKLMPVLLLLALGCMIYLISDKAFDRSIFWNTSHFSFHMKQILITFMGISIFLGLFTYLVYADRFFVFPIDKPNATLIFVLMYPLLGALPQEIIFKCFFFHRYRSVFPGTLSLIIFNGLSFGLFHLWYANIIAPIFSIFAGMILSYRYLKTKSLLAISIEHSLMGIFLYVVGLGWFFYSGSIQ
ncbi:MAG: CPBP family intramembrane glutamic endopeptidase [Desulfosalsimonadaceae bacterium]